MILSVYLHFVCKTEKILQNSSLLKLMHIHLFISKISFFSFTNLLIMLQRDYSLSYQIRLMESLSHSHLMLFLPLALLILEQRRESFVFGLVLFLLGITKETSFEKLSLMRISLPYSNQLWIIFNNQVLQEIFLLITHPNLMLSILSPVHDWLKTHFDH